MPKTGILTKAHIIENIAEGHGRYHFNDRLDYCYYAKGFLEETKSWISKAIRRKLFKTEISEIGVSSIYLRRTK